jgi:hypothetical protein
VFIVAFGTQFRILEIETEIDEELIAAGGFNGVFIVEPVVA